MSHEEATCQGCAEYQELSRRGFMGVAGAATLTALAAPAWLPRVTMAKDYRSGQRDVVISIFLRGAADGLTLCVPWTENNYYTQRPTIAIPRPDSGQALRATDLGVSVPGPNGPTGFGLPPGMAALLPAFQAGHLLIVHAAGSVDPSRSHFDAQHFMEVGKAQDPSLTTGWLGRHLLNTAPADPNALLRAVGISTGLQRTLVGGPLTLPVPNLDTFGLSGNSGTLANRTTTIHNMYAATPDPIQSIGLDTLDTINLLNTINFATYAPAGGAVYGADSFNYAMKTTAALIKAQVGVEAIAIDVSGWDTHANQGPLTGAMNTLMSQVAGAMAAFHTDLTTGTAPTFTMIVMSEFGRRFVENGSLGSDHGHGNVMLLMGNCITGGRVLAQWPGCNQNQLYQGLDLQVTTDYRDILSEICVNRLGNTSVANLFPGYTPTFRGVTATC